MVQVADYVSQLFPNFGPQEIKATAAQYAGLGTNIFQVNAIMGECEQSFVHYAWNTWTIFFDPNSKLTVIFICLTCYMLPAFHGRAFKVCCFSLYLPLFYFLNLILFRVNSLYHLVHMSTTQSRRYLGRYLDVWKIIFRVIF